MKKKLFAFIALLLIGAVVYGGSGVNVYFFCCNDCRTEGVNAVLEHKCCEIHHHHHLGGLITHYDDHSCTRHLSEASDEYGVERVSYSWSSYTHQIDIQPVFHYLTNDLFLVNAEPEILANVYSSIPHYSDTQKPPNLSEDIYFDLLNTLII